MWNAVLELIQVFHKIYYYLYLYCTKAYIVYILFFSFYLVFIYPVYCAINSFDIKFKIIALTRGNIIHIVGSRFKITPYNIIKIYKMPINFSNCKYRRQLKFGTYNLINFSKIKEKNLISFLNFPYSLMLNLRIFCILLMKIYNRTPMIQC